MGIPKYGDQIGWEPFVQGTKILGTICPWRQNLMGTVCPGGQKMGGTEVRGSNGFGTKCVAAQFSTFDSFDMKSISFKYGNDIFTTFAIGKS